MERAVLWNLAAVRQPSFSLPAKKKKKKMELLQNGSSLVEVNGDISHVPTAGALNSPASEKWQPLVCDEAGRAEANGAEISAWIWANTE